MFDHPSTRFHSVSDTNFLIIDPSLETTEEHTKYTKDFCAELSQHLLHLKNLPPQCLQYSSVVSDLNKRDKDTSHPTQWLG